MIIYYKRSRKKHKNLISVLMSLSGSRDSAVGIATGYGLDEGGVGVRVPIGSRIFASSCRPDRLCPPPHPPVCPMSTVGPFPGE
jgi:hypothetical protein